MKGKLSDRMLPAPVGGGFAMDGYWVWCGSVIKGEDGRYHMFASRWPQKFPMHPGWLVASEIVRASCDTPPMAHTNLKKLFCLPEAPSTGTVVLPITH